MTWKECKLLCLQTMFSNETAELTVDDSNQDYIYAMPGKANEAMLQLCTVGRPLLRTFYIQIMEDAEEGLDADLAVLTLPARDAQYKINMEHYCPRFRCLEADQIFLDDGEKYAVANDWRLEGDTMLCLPGNTEGTYTVWYAAFPKPISAATADDEVLELTDEAAALVPLYMAGALYKEDELAMATVFRNEFEDGLAKLREAYQNSPGGGGGFTRVRNTTGWW